MANKHALVLLRLEIAGKWRCFPAFSDETPICDVKYVHFIDEYAGSL